MIDSVPVSIPATVVSRVARVVIEPRDQAVTFPANFLVRSRFIDALGNTVTPETAAEGGQIHFFTGDNGVGTVTPLVTDPQGRRK